MVAYAFETITHDQAQAIRAGDTLTFNGGPGRTVDVRYFNYDPLSLLPVVPQIVITYGGKTVSFDTSLVQLSKTGGLVMADGSQLYIGDTSGERFTAGAGDDGVYGGPGDDALYGGDGGDFIHGNADNDTLVGGAGSDTIHGGQGDDVIVTNRETAALVDEQGDWAHGNLGDDQITAGAGRDTLYGGQGADQINGGDGSDYIAGDLGDDQLQGGLGSDTLLGGAGNDTLDGGFGLDMLAGGEGDDRLVAQGPEIVILAGEAGSDTLTAASADKDILLGGSGRDRFEIINKTDPATRVDAEIQDWEDGDQLHFVEVSIFGVGAASILPREYSEFVATDYASALALANEHITFTGAKYVSAQVGQNVFVFADLGDPADGADSAVLLVGRSLNDIGLDDFA